MHPHSCWEDIVTLVTCYSVGLCRLGFKQISRGSKEGFLLSTVLGSVSCHGLLLQRQHLILTDDVCYFWD